ncbi:Four helix bundle protein [Candidatus Desulfarcum epimagneticum]|uniref:Four helix bundle protein n=1 Tax=uncultured Desulfobacteraceae bacterium TaxID=218296 RepID=A0A484HCM6_9BACT|nr:Four helix bundle protein [uncultured Desulfobacteraceae bacterium]
MSTIKKFEDINAWKVARELVKEVYDISASGDMKKDFGLSDQIKRAGASVMANIAEGFARKSSKDFCRFLFMAKASAAEVQSHLYIALDQKYIHHEKFHQLYEKSEYIQKLLSNFIKYLNQTNP